MSMKTMLYLAMCALVSSVFAFAGTHSVSGRVLDPGDNAIPNVQIQAYREQRALGSPATSDRGGNYRITYPDGKPLDSIRYDHSDWYPAVIERISGSNTHIIHKTLYKRGQNLTVFEAHDVICSFETAADLDVRNDAARQNAEKFKYKEALDDIEKLPLPLDLRQRVKAIRQKYGI